jgi:hypothetical protein
MREPPWKSLAEHLKIREVKRPYLGRLTAQLDIAVPVHTLEREIIEEMAHALRRTDDKLGRALHQLELAGRELETASDRRERGARVATYNQQRQRALQARWELIIHREALGFRRHDDVDRIHPIPPPARA